MSFPFSSSSKSQEEENTKVKEHYNNLTKRNIEDRSSSPIYGIKTFNNWIKTILIHLAIDHLSSSSKKKIKVLDLACGTGGDWGKFQRFSNQIEEYYGIDCAKRSIEIAEDRYRQKVNNNNTSYPLIKSSWKVADLKKQTITLSPPSPSFQLVSCQFAFHYACSSEESVRQWLSNISNSLQPGGVFIATFPNSNHIQWLLNDKLNKQENNKQLKMKEKEWSIEFVTGPKWNSTNTNFIFSPEFGHCYLFTLEEAVQECPEYLVPLERVKEIAAESTYQLECKQHWSHLGLMYEEFSKVPKFERLLVDMKVVNEKGEFQLTPSLWQLVQLYQAILFVKK